MKTLSLRLLPLAALSTGLALVTFAGCSKQERVEVSAKAKDAYADSKAAMANAWDSVKAHTFEKRNDFAVHTKALGSKMDAELSDLRANYSEAKASASRRTAMDELKNSEADFKAKVAALGNATAATWDSGKQNVIASWDHLQAAYYKARAN